MKTKTMTAVLTAACLLFSGCAGSSSEQSGTTGETTEGTYAFSETAAFNDMTFETPWTLVLNKDGSYTLTSEDMMGKTTVNGTYTMDDDTHITTGTPKEKGFSPIAAWFNEDKSCEWIIDPSAMTALPVNYTDPAGGTASSGKPEGKLDIGGGDSGYGTSYSGTKYLDTAYASQSDAQKMDILIPSNPAEGNPVVVMIHGGAFMMGDKEMSSVSQCFDALLDAGYAVASVNYRLSSEAIYPAAVADVKAAVRYLKAEASTYGISAENIYVWGESAGAYLANMVAETSEQTSLNGDVSDNLDQSSQVKGLVSFFAPVDFYNMDSDFEQLGIGSDQRPMGITSSDTSAESTFIGQNVASDKSYTDSVSPLSYIGDMNATEFYAFIEHGNADTNVPYLQSQRLYDELSAQYGSVNVTFTLLDGAAHEDDAFYTAENLGKIVAFLNSIPKV